MRDLNGTPYGMPPHTCQSTCVREDRHFVAYDDRGVPVYEVCWIATCVICGRESVMEIRGRGSRGETEPHTS